MRALLLAGLLTATFLAAACGKESPSSGGTPPPSPSPVPGNTSALPLQPQANTASAPPAGSVVPPPGVVATPAAGQGEGNTPPSGTQGRATNSPESASQGATSPTQPGTK